MFTIEPVVARDKETSSTIMSESGQWAKSDWHTYRTQHNYNSETIVIDVSFSSVKCKNEGVLAKVNIKQFISRL